MIKRTIIVMLAVALIFSGCSKKDQGSTNSVEFENATSEETQEMEEIQEAIIETVEETEETEEMNSEEVTEVTDDNSDVDTVTVNTLEYEDIFTISKEESETIHKDMKILRTHNSFTLTWDSDDAYSYFKLYASSTEDGTYNLIKPLYEEVKDDENLLPYSVALKDFEPGARVYIKVSAVELKDDEIIETPFGDIVLYESETVAELDNDELQVHLIKKFPIIGTGDETIQFRFYDRYIIEETSDEIVITSNLKGEYIEIFNNAMETDYKDEIIKSIQDIYTYVFEVRGKKVIGVIEDEITITVNDLENISIELK